MKNSEKPANPIYNSDGLVSHQSSLENKTHQQYLTGLTKREYFAGLAMSAMISNPQIIRPKEDDQGFAYFSERAIRYADELLKQLENETIH